MGEDVINLRLGEPIPLLLNVELDRALKRYAHSHGLSVKGGIAPDFDRSDVPFNFYLSDGTIIKGTIELGRL